MLFLLSFHTNLRAFAALDVDGRNGLVERHVHYHEEVLPRHARIVESRGLEPPTEAVTVRPSDGEIAVTDGPPHALEDAVMGVYLIDCRDRDHAVELASMYPMPEGLGCIEVRPVTQRWEYAPSVEAAASAEAVWQQYADPSTWPEWKACVEAARLDGPLAPGASGTITPTDGEPLPIRIVDAVPGEGYTSETELAEGATLRLEHTISPLADAGVRITHKVTMPRRALDVYGMDFSPRFNDGMHATLNALAARAAESDLAGGSR